jgi:hypothetical protein
MSEIGKADSSGYSGKFMCIIIGINQLLRKLIKRF